MPLSYSASCYDPIITGGDPIGVGESTTPHMNQYLHYMGIPDAVFMPAARATYKSSSRFEGFVAEGEVFHYPNGHIIFWAIYSFNMCGILLNK